jgi:3-deoxy-manno-octulosonate cytidylyltransferase (CMP-KDO synthetase)
MDTAVALIPARYASTRFPAKLVQDLGGKSVIQRTYESTLATGLFDQVVVVTDHETIAEQIQAIGGDFFLSTQHFESGSDRIAEAAATLSAKIIVNIQGDEPFQDHTSLKDLLKVFSDKRVGVASMMYAITEKEALNPNAVKVICNSSNDALYFSRSPIPYNRENLSNLIYWKHVGVYAFRKDILINFTRLPKGNLEQIEMLEQLRLLENGISIRMVPTVHRAIAIDTEDDYKKAIAYFNSQRLK